MPAKGDGMRWSNSDPITGQAAWFDVRVKLEKVPPKEQNEDTKSQPQFNRLKLPPTMPNRPNIIKYVVNKDDIK